MIMLITQPIALITSAAVIVLMHLISLLDAKALVTARYRSKLITCVTYCCELM